MVLWAGVGIGIWIVPILLFIAVLSCIVFTRTSATPRTISLVVFFASIITVVLLLVIPTADKVNTQSTAVVDDFFILRYVLLAVGCLAILIGLLFVLATHCIEPIYAKPMKLQ